MIDLTANTMKSVMPSDILSAIHPIRSDRTADTALLPRFISDPIVARCFCVKDSCSIVDLAVIHEAEKGSESISMMGENALAIQ